MSFLCTTINRKVSHHQCVNECQYFFKSACIDKMNEAYNQALEDMKKELIKIYNKRYMHDIYLDDIDDIVNGLIK